MANKGTNKIEKAGSFFQTSKMLNRAALRRINNKFSYVIEYYGSTVILLSIRLWMAEIFYSSASSQLLNMDNTIYLFEYVYFPQSSFSPVVMAYNVILFELFCSILIFFGLVSRLAIFPLIIITMITQTYIYQTNEHYYWIFLLLVLFVYGSGKISVDKWLNIK